jgi:predicted permease
VYLPLDWVRHGLRLAGRQKGLAALAALALALGIGLTTTMFSILDAMVLRGLPFANASRLMHLEMSRLSHHQGSLEVPVHDYLDWRDRQRSFEGLAAFRSGSMTISAPGERAERVQGAHITAGAFELVGVRAALGRTLAPEDDRPGAAPVVILGHALWRDRFGADPGALGTTLRVDGQTTTIVGVMPERFQFPVRDALWVPLRPDPLALPRGTGDTLEVFGPLKPGLSLEQARAEMATITRALELEHPDTNAGLGSVVKPYTVEFVGEQAVALLWVMLAAVFGVLLVACANVANLLLARASLRVREMGIRTALGASRARLVAQLLGESAVLAGLGGLVGLLLARLGVLWFNRSIPLEMAPFWFDVRIDARAALFVTLLVMLSALVAGLAPALQASRGDVSEVLRDDARTGTGLRLGRLSRALVTAEVALACGLLVAAGLMIRSVANLRPSHFPFATANLLTARVVLNETGYPDAERRAAFYAELERRLGALPGVRKAALGLMLPGPGGARDKVAIEGAPLQDERQLPLTVWSAVSRGFFEAFEVGLLQGRGFEPRDDARAPRVAIVNRAFVARHFPDGQAIGRRVRLVFPGSDPAWREIVGVVPDLNIAVPLRPQREAVYLPLAQAPERGAFLVLRTAGPPLALASSLRGALAELDPDLAAENVQTFARAIHGLMWGYQVIGRLFVAFGAAALLLAAIGVYGVMAFAVGQRTREIGLRMALGASGFDILAMILGQGGRQLGLGLAAGLVLALALSRLVAFGLVGVSPNDPGTFATVVLTLLGAGLAACLGPARRAARLDPAGALRYD